MSRMITPCWRSAVWFRPRAVAKAVSDPLAMLCKGTESCCEEVELVFASLSQ